MTLQEHIVDILVLQKQGYTPTEIARRVQCDPRTVRRYLADPALLGKPVTRQKRGSKLDPYRTMLEDLLKEGSGLSRLDHFSTAVLGRIHRRLYPRQGCRAGYQG